MGKFTALFAVFFLVFIQYVHAAVLDGADSQLNSKTIDLADIHYDDQADPHEEHDDDHGLGSLHKLLHDVQNIAFLVNFLAPATTLPGGPQSLPNLDLSLGLSHSPPVPPPLS